MGAYDISFCSLLLQATLSSCQSPFTPVQMETNLELHYTGNGKDYLRYKTKLVTEKNGHSSFSRPLSLSLLHLYSYGLMPPTLFHISLQLQTLVQLCSVSAQRTKHIGKCVVGVTSALRRGPKTNINTVKHKCYHLVECIFWLP